MQPSPCFAISTLFAFLFTPLMHGQSAPAAPPLVVDAVRNQVDDYQHQGWGLRYRVHRKDGTEDSERDLIESRDGNVARTYLFRGAPLTPAENTAERKRLERITAADMQHRLHNAENTEKYAVDLIRAMPQAMVYTPVDASLPGVEHPVAAFDFKPNPAFHPATTAQSVLPCIEGRVWIDTETHHLVRIEVRVMQNVNLMFGILARVYSGGTLAYEQRPVGGGHYGYTRIDVDIKLRELMLKVTPYRALLTATGTTYMPEAPGFQDAVKMLLATP